MSNQTTSNPTKINTSIAENFKWGTGCNGWHLLKSDDLSIVEEIMPPGSKGVEHYHEIAKQFFYIIEGEASLVIDKKEHLLKSGDGMLVSPGLLHQIRNKSSNDLHFLAVSSPECFKDKVSQ